MSEGEYSAQARKVRIGLSTLYFLTYLSLGVYWTYGNIYFRGQGLSVSEIGVLNAVYYAVAILGHPFFGLIYDRVSNKYKVIAFTSILASVSALLVPLQTSMLLRVVVYGSFSLFLSSLMPLLDAWTLIWCHEGDHPFERIRLWGSFGYLFSSVLGGTLLERLDLVWAYFTPSLVLGVICVAVIVFHKTGSLPSKEASRSLSQSSGGTKELRDVIRSGPFLRLVAISFFYRIALTGPMSLLTVYFDHNGLSAVQIGYAMIIGGLSEMFVIIWNQKLFEYMSGDTLLAVSMLTSGVRWVFLISAKNPFGLLATQVFEGLNYMLFYLVAVQKVTSLFPKELAGAGQTIFGSVFYGLGPVIGSLASGIMVDRMGFERSFGLFSLLCFFVGLVHIITAKYLAVKGNEG
ncbi:MAG TPA: MFS transporter, partial [Bacillota bacterium]|nr:MFS transporter [Bacillota bacterium]